MNLSIVIDTTRLCLRKIQKCMYMGGCYTDLRSLCGRAAAILDQVETRFSVCVNGRIESTPLYIVRLKDGVCGVLGTSRMLSDVRKGSSRCIKNA